MPHLVGFSGVSGTGKTTFIRELSRTLRSIGYSVGVVRKRICKGQDRTAMLEQFCMQIREESNLLKLYDIVLADKTIYDHLFFTLFYYYSDYPLLKEYMTLLELAEAKYPFRKYSVVFHCVSGNRKNKDIYKVVQQYVLRRLIPPSIPTVVVPEASVKEKVDLCFKTLVNLGIVSGGIKIDYSERVL